MLFIYVQLLFFSLLLAVLLLFLFTHKIKFWENILNIFTLDVPSWIFFLALQIELLLLVAPLDFVGNIHKSAASYILMNFLMKSVVCMWGYKLNVQIKIITHEFITFNFFLNVQIACNHNYSFSYYFNIISIISRDVESPHKQTSSLCIALSNG